MDNNRNFFKSNICHCCKKAAVALKRCASCKTVAYCSRDHQLQDWKSHKQLCKIISKSDGLMEYNVKNHEELVRFKHQRALVWKIQLQRKLERFESQMWMFPRICAVCYKRESLFDCHKCLSECYCSKEHEEKHQLIHKKFCSDLKLAYDIEKFFYFNSDDVNVFSVKRVKEELRCIPESIDFINYVLKSHAPTTSFHYINSCDQNLCGINILFALEQANILVNRKLPKKSLEIHIVGSTLFEYSLNWILIIETYFHWIKNLEEIHIVFIGPEMKNQTSTFQLFKTQFCRKCQARNNLTVKDADMYKNLYHEKVEKLDKPDIVVTFNSGLHEFANDCSGDLWKDSLSFLVFYSGVPLLLTAYTEEEMRQDLSRIKSIENVEVIYGPTKNPFSNIRPLLDWETQNMPIFFINSFVAVVRKK